MRRRGVLLSLVLLLALGFYIFAGHKALQRDPRGHCTSIIVGKDATADGSVLLGHNEDWGVYLRSLCWNPAEKHKPGETFRLKDGQEIPQVDETFAFIWPAADCNGINERQVAIFDNTGSCRKELFQNERGIDLEEFMMLALQRSKTAREAVETMGRLMDKYGYRTYNGEDGDVASIADPAEGWLMEITIGGLWVAERIPNDQFVVLANRFRIGEVNLKDSTRFLGSPNLIDYATKRGWFDPAKGPFNFQKAYGDPERSKAVYNTRREWRGNCLLGRKQFPEDANPLTVTPSKKLTPRDLMSVFRDHYEGTAYDLSRGYEKGSPHHTSGRTICVMSTDASTVAQLRSWLPDEIGGVLWLSAGTPCSSVYVPYYLGVWGFPLPYSQTTPSHDRNNAFWTFNSLENLVDRYYGQRTKIDGNDTRAIDYVVAAWKKFEDESFAIQESVEKTALDLYKKDKGLARSFLDLYSNALSLRAYDLALKLGDQLRTSFYR
jgi:dipeptidase